jgi:putative membrane protein
LTIWQVNRLADAIAVINTGATASLLVGWYWIRQGAIEKHRTAMLTAFSLILLFLVVYLLKVGGGGTKEFIGPTLASQAYLGMLAIHIFLSIIAVPVVLYQVVTGLTYTPGELRHRTRHRTIGRLAATAWIISLALGVVTYLLLNHVYEWRFIG